MTSVGSPNQGRELRLVSVVDVDVGPLAEGSESMLLAVLCDAAGRSVAVRVLVLYVDSFAMREAYRRSRGFLLSSLWPT